jgi:hypothetical protein
VKGVRIVTTIYQWKAPDSPDEHRLIAFFYCLSPEQQDEVLQNVGRLALRRCFPDPDLDLFQFMPEVDGISRSSFEEGAWDEMVAGTPL